MINKLVEELNEAQKEKLKRDGYINECFFNGDDLTEEYTFKKKEKKKYIYLDVSGSGWFMVLRETGEIFGIKAYGTINKNKFYGRIGEVKGKDIFKLKLGVYY